MKQKHTIAASNKSVHVLDEFERMFPRILANQPYVAKVTRAKYLEMLKAGFDEKQALELCK